VLDGKRMILFGPFATFSTKFLKQGSLLDLLGSTTIHNTWPMVRVGVREFDLVQYLIGQVLQSDDDRFAALQTYFPEAKPADWRLWQAGQRVQIIKKDEARVACSSWVPRSSPPRTAASPGCWAPRRGLDRAADHARPAGQGVQGQAGLARMAGQGQADHPVVWHPPERAPGQGAGGVGLHQCRAAAGAPEVAAQVKW
jgi:hypothetical protein